MECFWYNYTIINCLLTICVHNYYAQTIYYTDVSKCEVRSGGCTVERRTVSRGDGGSIPPAAVSKLRQFRSPHICLCLSEEILKAGGPFYLVSMPGEVIDPTQGVNV